MEGEDNVFEQPQNKGKAASESKVFLPSQPISAGNPKKPLSAAGMQFMMKKSQMQQKAELEERLKLAAQTAPILPIEHECKFEGDLYMRKRMMPEHPGFYLLLRVHEQTLRSAVPNPAPAPEDDMEVVSYACFELFNRSTGRINSGEFTASLYNSPVSIPMPLTDALPGKIVFTVNEIPTAAGENVPPKSRSLRFPPTTPEDGSKTGPIAYIQKDAKFEPVPFDEKDGFAFYVDGMRYVPESCGPVNIRMQGYFRNGSPFLAQEQRMCPDPYSKIKMPSYRNFLVYDFTSGINPTAIMVGTLVMFDEITYRDRVLGYIVINMFVDPATLRAIDDPTTKSFQLLVGDFQLPIYCESPLTAPPLSMERMYSAEL